MDEKERNKLAVQKYRAKQSGLENSLTSDEWETILRSWNYTCAYCGQFYEEMDHVVPVSEGGGTTASNCIPACHKCNARKGCQTWSIEPKQLKLWT